MPKYICEKEKGVSLYLALMIMVILLALVLGLSTIFLSQIRMIKEMENSVVAFYAADTGIEKALMGWSIPCPDEITPPVSLGDAEYEVKVDASGPNCDADNCCIRSYGTYQGTTRAIEVKY